MGRNRFNRPTARWGVSRRAAESAGYRSSYELAIAQALEAEGVEFQYETCTYKVQVKAGTLYACGQCLGPVVKTVSYTPDFTFRMGAFKVIVEAKGRFDASHRIKAKAFKEQAYDGIVYAMCFEADNKLSKTSKTRYTDWCKKNGIPCKIGLITKEWLESLVT